MNPVGKIVASLLVLGVFFIWWGTRTERSDNIDTRESAAVPYFIGAAAIVLDVLIVVGYAVYRLFAA